jgi:hypothetical protein
VVWSLVCGDANYVAPSMEEGHFSEYGIAQSRIPFHLWNPEINSHVHNRPLLDPILRKMNLVLKDPIFGLLFLF